MRGAKERWTAIKVAIADSQNFLDLVSGLNWREGLTIEAMNIIRANLSTGGGGGGVGGGGGGGGSGKRGGGDRRASIMPQQQQGLVSLSAARHAAEVVEIIFQFAVGMVRYTGLLQSHLLALEKLNR